VQSRSGQSPKPTAEEVFGRTLRERRKELGMSQEALAFQSGYHPTYIGQLERGLKSPSLRALMSLSGVLKTRASELIARVETLLAS
jgi:transcriptional regulator with XRE-family HTH domain